MVENKTATQKHDSRGTRPNVPEEIAGFRSGKDQCNAVSIFRQLLQPLAGFTAVRRVTPNTAMPGFAKAVVFNRIVGFGHFPRPDYRSAGIKIKLTQGSDYFGRGQPFTLALCRSFKRDIHAFLLRTSNANDSDYIYLHLLFDLV
jgi:hypothetical protein